MFLKVTILHCSLLGLFTIYQKAVVVVGVNFGKTKMWLDLILKYQRDNILSI